jgi:hypothetical protein
MAFSKSLKELVALYPNDILEQLYYAAFDSFNPKKYSDFTMNHSVSLHKMMNVYGISKEIVDAIAADTNTKVSFIDRIKASKTLIPEGRRIIEEKKKVGKPLVEMLATMNSNKDMADLLSEILDACKPWTAIDNSRWKILSDDQISATHGSSEMCLYINEESVTALLDSPSAKRLAKKIFG